MTQVSSQRSLLSAFSMQFKEATSASLKTPHYNSETLSLQVVSSLLIFSGLLFLVAVIGFAVGGHQWGFHAINNTAPYIPDVALHHITSFGDGLFVVSLILIIANRNIPLLYTSLLAAIIGGLVSQSLKRYFNADRPPAALELDAFNLVGKAYYSRSFPSGHTLTAFLVATVLVCFSKRTSTRIALMSLALLVGLSRVWLGVHWLIDILVGGALGILCALIAVYFARKSKPSVQTGFAIATLILFFVTAVSVLFEPNDYYYAQAMISLAALYGVWVSLKHYVLPTLYRAFGVDVLSIKAPASQNAVTSSVNKNRLSLQLFIASLVIITAYRILAIAQPHLALFYDEAYYYHWSLNPDLGYYSKPPFVAWCVAATTWLFGHSVLAIKLAAPLLYSLSAFIIFLVGRKVSSTSSGIVAGLIFISSTVIGFNSVFITTDAPLIFFWSLSIYLYVLAVESQKTALWIGLGVSVGLGMLSKYTMALLPASIFICMAVNNQLRPALQSFKPWLAAVIAGLIFAVNLYWNAQHNWISFAHTSEISQQGKQLINIAGFLEFIAGQIFVLGPVWCWLGFKLILKRKELAPYEIKSFSYAPMLFTYITLGILIVISLQAISSRAFINWAAPWVVGASLLLGIYASNLKIGQYLRIGLSAHLLLLSAFYHWPALLEHIQVTPSKKNNPYQRLAGWEGVGAQLQPYIEQHPDAILASDSRDLLAYIGFHAMPGRSQFARWNKDESNVRDHYDLKFNFRNYIGAEQEFIYVAKQAVAPEVLSRFQKARYLGRVTQTVFVDKQHTVFIYHLKNFIGYQ